MSNPGAEDVWHVEVEPGTSRVVTLEQLDDMFRLDIISADTRVWQPGMTEPLPLSVIAGIDDDADEAEEIEDVEVVEPLPAFAATASIPAPSAPPPPASVRPPSIQPSPTVSVGSMPPPNLSQTWPASAPPPPQGALAQTLPAPMHTLNAPSVPPSMPPSGQDWAMEVQSIPQAPLPSPESLNPMALSQAPVAPEAPSRVGAVVTAFAVAAGLMITLYRNDVLRDTATSAGLAPSYESLEAAVGSPGFGTTRSVEKLAKVLAPVDQPLPLPRKSSQDSSSEDSEASDNDGAAPSVAVDSLKTEQKAAKSAPRNAAPVRRGVQPRTPPKSKVKGSKLEYDPMNGTL